MRCCSHIGMFSNGVAEPESMYMTTNTGTASRPNCGMDDATVASRMPSAVSENR